MGKKIALIIHVQDRQQEERDDNGVFAPKRAKLSSL